MPTGVNVEVFALARIAKMSEVAQMKVLKQAALLELW